MKNNLIMLISLSLLMTALYGCSTGTINAPCPDYGKWCRKTPVNSWNYYH